MKNELNTENNKKVINEKWNERHLLFHVISCKICLYKDVKFPVNFHTIDDSVTFQNCLYRHLQMLLDKYFGLKYWSFYFLKMYLSYFCQKIPYFFLSLFFWSLFFPNISTSPVWLHTIPFMWSINLGYPFRTLRYISLYSFFQLLRERSLADH